MPTKRLPPSASLAHLKHQAKDLLADFRKGEMSAYQRIREFHPKSAALSDDDIAARTFTLGDALLSIAREYGYQSWPRLKTAVAQDQGAGVALTHNERIGDTAFRQALDLLDEGNEAMLQAHLDTYPEVAHQQVVFEGDNYFTHPRLIEFVAENPTRQERLPENIVAIARIILEAGAKKHSGSLSSVLELVASGRVVRECGVQLLLLDLFCTYGADPATAMAAALVHGEFEAARHLISLGAPLDLAGAAALGMARDVGVLLPNADAPERQLALALAALHGRADVADMVLKAGADPNRYNPAGGHSHCTALHSAALAGHIDTVRVLLAAGARSDLHDIHHKATPADWAAHAGHAEVAALLQSGV